MRGMLAAEPDIEVVGQAASGSEAVALAQRRRPDVILMDLRAEPAVRTEQLSARETEVLALRWSRAG